MRLVSAREAIDRATPEGRLQTGILAEFAEFEREKIKARTRDGIRQRASTGKPWGEPSYGYAKGRDGDWIIEPAEAAIARRIFVDRVERGRSYSAIARTLNAERVPTRRGSQWSPTVVRRILTSRAVLGDFHHGGEWIRGQHEPIVSEDVWLAAQTLAERRAKYAPRGSGRVPKRHLFAQGMLRCGCCGAVMLPRSAPDQRDTYVCRTRKATGGADACPMVPLPRASVDYAAIELFTRWALDVEGTRRKVAEATDARLAE